MAERCLKKYTLFNAIQWNLCKDKDKRGNEPKGLHLSALIEAINQCVVPFTAWKKSNNNGKKQRDMIGEVWWDSNQFGYLEKF